MGDAPGSFPRTAAVVGLGLIGGSFALALRAAGAEVLGVDPDPAALALARERGAIVSGAADLAPVAGADLVVIATPLERVADVAVAAARRMRPGAVLTDVASVKAPVVATVQAALPAAVRFVGGHPMAGNEGRGMAAADAALLRGRAFILTPTSRTAPEAVAVMEAVIGRLGMRLVLLDPVQHDEFVAQVSHLPYLLSLALDRAIADDARTVGGPTMQEMTRAARSPAVMWEAICRANRDAILRALDRFEAELAAVRRVLLAQG
ncbi:MAG: prephenate dehydrogenase [Armatimonadota bacterium]|nr:prephenate dehydrogenase [Armatimonadota bacterium]MDR7456807.1 prephenate dehydrogenase [Armatimonadota bacterium]MDR7497826.1 prephenate dehydrogenase [Armatimonadota bacterium]MDR7512233.1 prephenate dehydrogenase [Armatimonadota bacterium]